VVGGSVECECSEQVWVVWPGGLSASAASRSVS
jgi:hypothetical protein